MKEELMEFKSNKSGYVKVQEYNELIKTLKEYKDSMEHSNKMTGAWKNQAGRFQIEIKNLTLQIQHLD